MEESVEEPVIASQSSQQTEPASSLPCTICRRQFSRYTCPRCNIPYCSLICFRSEKHGDCSESFYRKELESDVKSAPSATVEEKRRMMDLLKRFEDDALDDSPLLADSDDDDMDDLHKRLQNIDLDSASHDELWNALTPSEREKFLRALDDPSGELAQQLLASTELEKVQVEPWWNVPTVAEPQTSESSIVPAKRQQSRKPSIMVIPESLVKQSSSAAVSGPLLLYNICAVCIAYAYVVRHYAVSPLSSLSPTRTDHADVRRTIAQLVPFLADRKSMMVHTSLSSVTMDIWSRFPTGHMSPQFFSLLLKDTVAILRPVAVTVVLSPSHPTVNLEEHPSADALRVMSDLASLYTEVLQREEAMAMPTKSAKSKPNHIAHKLTFYSAHILGTPTPMLRVLVDEVTMRAKTLEREGIDVRGSDDVKRVERNPRPLMIEEV